MAEQNTAAKSTGDGARKDDERAEETRREMLQQRAREADSPLVTTQGTTTVEETVVQKLAGIAAREVGGVHSMGNAARRTFDAISERIPGSRAQVGGGVSVEKGEKEAAIDLTVIVEYGASVIEVAETIRRSVIRSVEHGTGLDVIEVNITVSDVHLPDDEEESQDGELA